MSGGLSVEVGSKARGEVDCQVWEPVQRSPLPVMKLKKIPYREWIVRGVVKARVIWWTSV